MLKTLAGAVLAVAAFGALTTAPASSMPMVDRAPASLAHAEAGVATEQVRWHHAYYGPHVFYRPIRWHHPHYRVWHHRHWGWHRPYYHPYYRPFYRPVYRPYGWHHHRHFGYWHHPYRWHHYRW